jgi:hypothetical protein
MYTFLGVFTKLRKATINFVRSVRPSVRMEQLGSHWTDFHEISYVIIFRKTVEKIHVSLKSEKINGHFTWKPIYIFDHNSLTSFVFNNFSLKSSFLRHMWKNIVERGRSQMTIWRMRIACWIHKAANTHSEYVTLLFHCSNGCKNAPRYYVIRTFACLVKDYLYLILLYFVFYV